MNPLINIADQSAECGMHDAHNSELRHYHVTSPDGRMQAERVVCEACLYEILAPWYPNAVVEEGAWHKGNMGGTLFLGRGACDLPKQ